MIVFEGLAGVGKSTQIELLNRFLVSRRHDVVVMRFPDKLTPIGMLLDTPLDPKVRRLLMLANRQEAVECIRGLLKSGVWVLVETFDIGGRAREGGDGATDIVADATVFIDADTTVVGIENYRAQMRLREAYESMSNDMRTVSGDGTPTEVHGRVLRACGLA